MQTAIRKKYPDVCQFMARFTPDLQADLDEDTAIVGRYPLLADFRMCYGKGAAESWLMIQLNDLSEYSGVRLKLTTMQLEETARTILREYHYLKVTEIMLFLRKCKCGVYGKFYGSVDPMVITSALRKFVAERGRAIDRIENARRAAERNAPRPDAMTRGEWLAYRPWAEAGYSLTAYRKYLSFLGAVWGTLGSDITINIPTQYVNAPR